MTNNLSQKPRQRFQFEGFHEVYKNGIAENGASENMHVNINVHLNICKNDLSYRSFERLYTIDSYIAGSNFKISEKESHETATNAAAKARLYLHSFGHNETFLSIEIMLSYIRFD